MTWFKGQPVRCRKWREINLVVKFNGERIIVDKRVRIEVRAGNSEGEVFMDLMPLIGNNRLIFALSKQEQEELIEMIYVLRKKN